MSTNHQPYLPMEHRHVKSEEIVEINTRLWFAERDGYRVVYQGWETPLHCVAIDDQEHMRLVAVSLCLSGLAKQEEVAGHFGMSLRTLQRSIRRYQAGGLDGLRRKKGKGRRRKIGVTQEAYVRRWFERGESNREMARRLGVTEGTVRSALKRMGLKASRTEATASMFAEDGEDEPQEGEEDAEPEAEEADDAAAIRPLAALHDDPLDRSVDRVLAALGKIDDADPIFAEAEGLPRVGVFLAVALLAKSGVVDIFARLYRSIGPAFYGLRTSVVCMVILALLRIKRPENVKEHPPQSLGRLLGLDRAPEVKTLRRKMAALAARGQGKELMRALAEHHVEAHEEVVGVLYVDGHVKEYSGQAPLSKAYNTRRRLPAPGETATWVNDLQGDPLFVVPSPMNAGLSKTLLPVLSEVRELLGTERELTVVFDRGGWSTRLFHQLMTAGFHLITYRRGHDPRIAPSEFVTRTFVADGHRHEYAVHDQRRVRLGRTGERHGAQYVWMRQVTRLRDGNRQTPVITDRQDLAPEHVLYLMFNRWRQENFFKYLRDEFALDALVEYGAEPVDAGSDRPNPEIRELDKEISREWAALADAQQVLGIALEDNEERQRPTVRGFKIAHAELLRGIEKSRQRIARLEARKATLPKRVPAHGVMRLKRERKIIADAIKMIAYRLESDLARRLSAHYARSEQEGRTLLHTVFQAPGDIAVTDGELRITLAPLSSPHRTRAIAALCQDLTKLRATFPGTGLRLVLEAPEPATIA
jgi:transposase